MLYFEDLISMYGSIGDFICVPFLVDSAALSSGVAASAVCCRVWIGISVGLCD